ncbi:hypothetical protein [Paraburkholderia bryophila]|uniref:Uncharacterized protein n=1 Tax=Paraburkholderia bryophila TaxID=420952 RepID=A0A329CAQ2_9BURK|nr:hypothetical protein [Paraburkholderia bryophila]RAS32066.1 hypothetical protein BX591_108174 [Paraburkholderia bryophila]
MLHPDKIRFMQRLQQAAVHQHVFYVAGRTNLAGFDRLTKKFADAYDTELSRQTKHKRRLAGEASSCLHGLRLTARGENDQLSVDWVLLVSAGLGLVTHREQLQDLRDPRSRLKSPDQRHELVHDGKTWSWRLTHRCYNHYADRIHRIASLPPDRRRQIEINGVWRDADAEILLDRLYAEPGFRLVRRQVGKLVAELRRDWKRLRPASGPQPSERSFLAYVRFLPNQPVVNGLTQAERREAFQIAFPDQAGTDAVPGHR